MYRNFPMIPYGEEIRQFFLITLGYHTLRTFQEMFKTNKRNDFVEMMLHHILTLVLYTGSYMINCVEIGILVVYCHDWADLFGHFAKSVSDTNFKAPKVFLGIFMWLSWLLARCVFFDGSHRDTLVRHPAQLTPAG